MATRPNSNPEPQFLYSPAFRASTSATFGLGSNLAWDAYQRELYKAVNTALQQQANLLVQRGGATDAEVKALIEQRNLAVMEARKPLSPFGRLYSEILKPSTDLPTFEKLVHSKGSVEAVLNSVGKTRAVTNRLTASLRVAGRVAVVLEIVVTVVMIAEARPEDRVRVIARQGGANVGGDRSDSRRGDHRRRLRRRRHRRRARTRRTGRVGR